LILITAEKYQWGQDPDLAMCWPDVYLHIKEWLNKAEGHGDKLDFLFKDFLTFLKDKHLAPIPSISREEILGYNILGEKSQKFFESIVNYETGGIYEFSTEDSFNPIVKEYRGRIGINIFSVGMDIKSEWLPGLFIGFLSDYERYKVKPIDKEKGPDCCLIIDYNEHFADNYRDDELYKKLVGELSQLFKDKKNGWEFHNHIEEDEYKKKWHPLHIRKPMANVLAYSKDIKYLHEQASIQFIEEISYPLQILAKHTCFNELRAANKNKIKLSLDQSSA
jgi:hypothetical protein